MSIVVSPALAVESEQLSRLVHESFLAFVAKDWSEAAVTRFLSESAPSVLASAIEASFLAITAKVNDEFGGLALLPRPSLLGMLFISPPHVGQGIGRALWEECRVQIEQRAPDVKTVELNSTPYAVQAYRALGFYPISEQFALEGCVATRMACWLPGRSRAKNAA